MVCGDYFTLPVVCDSRRGESKHTVPETVFLLRRNRANHEKMILPRQLRITGEAAEGGTEHGAVSYPEKQKSWHRRVGRWHEHLSLDLSPHIIFCHW